MIPQRRNFDDRTRIDTSVRIVAPAFGHPLVVPRGSVSNIRTGSFEVRTPRLVNPQLVHLARIFVVHFLRETGTGRVVSFLVQSFARYIIRTVPPVTGTWVPVNGTASPLHVTGTAPFEIRRARLEALFAHPVIVLGVLVGLLQNGTGVLSVTVQHCVPRRGAGARVAIRGALSVACWTAVGF